MKELFRVENSAYSNSNPVNSIEEHYKHSGNQERFQLSLSTIKIPHVIVNQGSTQITNPVRLQRETDRVDFIVEDESGNTNAHAINSFEVRRFNMDSRK